MFSNLSTVYVHCDLLNTTKNLFRSVVGQVKVRSKRINKIYKVVCKQKLG